MYVQPTDILMVFVLKIEYFVFVKFPIFQVLSMEEIELKCLINL